MRLLEDLSPVLRVGVVAEVSPLIHKALPIRVHDDAQRIGVLLVQIADTTVAVRRGVEVPGDRVTAAPVAARCGSGLKRHPNAVAGVELRSAYLRVLPARTQMLLAHLRIRLEPTAGEHDRTRPHLFAAIEQNTADLSTIVFQPIRSAAVTHLDARLFGQLEQPVRQPRTAAHRLNDQASPKPPFAVDLERLPSVQKHPAHASLAHPNDRRIRLVDQNVRQRCVRLSVADSRQVVPHLGCWISVDIY